MIRKIIDTTNTFKQHFIVAIFSLILAGVFHFVEGLRWSTSFARVSFILLFLTLIIGPIMRLKKPAKVFSPLKTPWTWRSELGIWFAVTGLIHVLFAMSGKPGWDLVNALGGFVGGEGYGFANFLGLIALVWAIVLAVTSSNKAIKKLGVDSWKWLQSFAYVIFYLVLGHTMYFQFFSTYGGGPDYFGYLVLVMAVLIIGLQIVGFVKTLKETSKKK